ncbi:unnamed protein product [Rhizoctonia solani]|uniref:Uncharacterized protein n=1 Tax=Rhizoctonia solani TaxID=456999 RepID=A0A8H3A0J0_9AGAM|nr:unnamed protein product [Rhizoctonia solani]
MTPRHARTTLPEHSPLFLLRRSVQAMIYRVNQSSPLRRTRAIVCVAREGKLCGCLTCTSSFVSIISTVSDISTTYLPSEIDEREISEELKITAPSRSKYQPLRAFPTDTTVVESVCGNRDNEASTGVSIGPDKRYMSFSRSPRKSLSRARTSRSLACIGSVSSIASDWALCSPKALQRTENVVTDTIGNEYEEPTRSLSAVKPRGPLVSAQLQRLGPTYSDCNLTPTPAMPLGRRSDPGLR